MPTKVKLNGRLWGRVERMKLLASFVFHDTRVDKSDLRNTAPYLVTNGAYTNKQ